jgi:hypothetical protein
MIGTNYGYWRPYILDVIYKYLDCGDCHLGFARVKCDDCQHEYLLPFSCKRRYFCPSCHQKRVLEFGEFLYTEVLKQVPHRQWVFSIPKRLRRYFMYDRSLLSELSRCAWKVLSLYLTQGVSLDDPKPGAVIAVQTFGDFLNFNPHLHIIATDGCFATDGGFMMGTEADASSLIDLFRGEVFKMLKKAGKIDDHIIENMLSWHHSGFNVYCGPAINPGDQEGLEKLAQYIIRAPLSQERLLYIPASEVPDGIARVIYRGKNSSVRESFMALDWLARLVTHIPNKGEQLVRYYGYYSNKSRGMRKKIETDVEIPALVESDISRKAFRRNWARLIQKIYHTDPLLCPKCSGHMRILSIIEDLDIVKKILQHLNLWATKNHDPPPTSSIDIEYACLAAPCHPWHHCTSPSVDVASVPLSIANDENLRSTRRVKAQEVSYEELPQLSFDEFSDDYVMPMPFEDEYSQWTPYED